MALLDSTVIIADDLTGANDTALQYFKNGHHAKIVVDLGQDFSYSDDVDVWSISTESRNINKEEAVERVAVACEKIKEATGAETFYKKIDSTLRGNVGLEIVTMLEVTQKDAAIIAPAYIDENRTTVGGYQLLNGMIIERTQSALDPKAPIFESYIPDILKKDLNENLYPLIDTIGLNVVTKGAGPIVLKLKELIEKGKKLIVVDAITNTDLEQIALAINKSDYDILPCGSAGLANAINKINDNDIEVKHLPSISNIARFLVSGSATQLTVKQIEKLKQEKPDIYYVNLKTSDIIEGIQPSMIDDICKNLDEGKDVVLHCCEIKKEKEEQNEAALNMLIDAGIAKDEFPSKITEFLSDLVYEVNLKSRFILIVTGGETSFECAKKIDSKYLEILDSILPAIPLCLDAKGKIIVTKSGNFGSASTFVDIFNYFDKLKQ